MREQWLVEDRWWTPKPLRRQYFELISPTAATRSSSASRRTRPVAAGGSSSGHEKPAYVELHAHSAYSFLDGVSLPEELAVAAAERGYEAFALTDHDNVCGAMEFAQACRGSGSDRSSAPSSRSPTSRTVPGRPLHLTLLADSPAGATSVACSPMRMGDPAPPRP